MCVYGRLECTVAPTVKACVKRVSQSAFRSNPQNTQSGKASLIEHLFGIVTGIVRKVSERRDQGITRRCSREREKREGGGGSGEGHGEWVLYRV